MRMALVISQLGPGGAERMLSAVANAWAHRGVAVSLITMGSTRGDFYSLHPSISRRPLGLEGDSLTIVQSVSTTIRRLRALRREIVASRPDVIISFGEMTNVLTILATRGLALPVLVSERIDPDHHEIGTLRSLSRRLAYRSADAVVVQTGQIAAAMERIVPRSLLRVIPNFTRFSADDSASSRSPFPSHRLVVSVGSLTPRKQFDVLLRAFAKLATRHQDWRLVILGEGSERSTLEKLAEGLGIRSKTHLAGLVADPERTLRRADLFAFTSRYEGFPNAVLEAMACGLPVVSFDCPGGPGSIIRNEIDGLLVCDQDFEELTRAMDRLMSSPSERRTLGLRAREVTERFGVDRIMGMWDDLVAEFTATPPPGRPERASPS